MPEVNHNIVCFFQHSIYILHTLATYWLKLQISLQIFCVFSVKLAKPTGQMLNEWTVKYMKQF